MVATAATIDETVEANEHVTKLRELIRHHGLHTKDGKLHEGSLPLLEVLPPRQQEQRQQAPSQGDGRREGLLLSHY